MKESYIVENQITLPLWPFYTASAVLLGFGCSIWHVSYLWGLPHLPPWQLVTTVCMMFLFSGLMFLWPYVLKARLEVLASLPDSVKQLETILADADAVMKSFGKARTALEALRESVEQEKQSFDEMREAVLSELTDFKQKDLELQEQRRESKRNSLEIDAWRNVAVDYFEYLQRVLDSYPSNDPKRDLLDIVADTFGKFSQARCVERVCPSVGDPFIGELHEASAEETALDSEPGCILRCEEWGYRSGSDVLKRAKVILAKTSAS